MTVSTPFLLKAIGDALRDEVLPALEQASWPAGNLRGCLMLLAYLEDRVDKEGPALTDTNVILRRLLGELAADADAPLDGALRRDMMAALARYPERAPYVPVAELAAENEAYQALLERLLGCAIAQKPNRDTSLRARLRACLAALDERDYAMVKRAEGYTPI